MPRGALDFGEHVMHMLPTKGLHSDAMGKLDPRWAYGYIMGYSKSSNEYYVFEEVKQKVTKVRSVQRVPADQRWKPEGLEAIAVTCQQLYERRPARGVQIEGFANDPNAKAHEVSKVRTQRVWMYEHDYTAFGITEDCKKCHHNQRWGYNKSRMLHSEQCRTRMETALATTDAGKTRLAPAGGRINHKLAK